MQALLFDRFGSADVLEYREVADPQPAPGHAIVRTRAIGLNFADIYRRNGNYHLSGVAPWILGYEAAGVIDSIAGEGFAIGDRVAFADSPHANAELVSVPIDKLVPLSDDISFETAAALMLQGLTAQYLVGESHRVVAGERVLVHAAAGGVGLLLVQLAKAAGAIVTGLVSSEEKRVAALEAGADEVLLTSDDWSSSARFDVVYDSVGAMLARSLDAVRVRGHVVFFGMAAGDPPLVDPRRLMDESKKLTGGDLWSYLTSAAERRTRSARLFADVRAGRLTPRIARMFPLRDGAEAHRFLESRQAIGKVLLTVS
ncbi:MAG TPA: quinone oxidoreductase [Thermoanaerobaculia bacterium]|nr:quinone oxidoreductase [Thermoanaerobaculia bacterium]